MNITNPPHDFRTVFTYDPEHGALIRISTGRPAGIKYKKTKHRDYGYVKYKEKEYPVHRVIWAVVYGSWPESWLDHIDHNKRNNKVENLRLATPLQNGQNLSKYKTNTSGRSGVIQTLAGGFQARIGYKNRRICLGTYDTLEEAYAVYEAVAKTLGFHPNHGK